MPIQLLLAAELLKIIHTGQVNVPEVNALVAQAESAECIQWCDIPMVNANGIVAPTSTTPSPTLEVLPVGSMYNVWDAPKF